MAIAEKKIKDIQDKVTESSFGNLYSFFLNISQSTNTETLNQFRAFLNQYLAQDFGNKTLFGSLNIIDQILKSQSPKRFHYIYKIDSSEQKEIFSFINEHDLETSLRSIPPIIFNYFSPPDDHPLSLRLIHDDETNDKTLVLYIHSKKDVNNSMVRLWNFDNDPRVVTLLQNKNLLVDLLFGKNAF